MNSPCRKFPQYATGDQWRNNSIKNEMMPFVVTWGLEIIILSEVNQRKTNII